jgi:hypothetical protein
MIFRSLCAFIWFKNIEKMLLQMTSGFLQLESTIYGKYSTQTMILWSLCAFIWFRNMKKMLLQMTSVSLQPVPSLKLTQVAKNHFAFATALLWH